MNKTKTIYSPTDESGKVRLTDAQLSKIFLVLLMFLLASLFSVNAKNIVKGKVLDNEGEPLPYASVVLKQGDKIVSGTLTNDDAMFCIDGSFNGDYLLTINFIGFNEAQRSLNFSGDNKIDLGEIQMEIVSSMLNEVVVSAEIPTKSMTVNKTTLSANTGAGAATGSILDILKSSASISIDNENNVSIRGNSNILILLDGVPTTLSSLNSIPTGNVQKIDVLTSPDVKYDSEGTGGIINIVSKRNNLSGFSSMAGFNYGFNDMMNGNLAFGYNIDKLTLRVNYNGSLIHDLVESSLYRQFTASGNSLNQSINSKQKKSNNVVGVDASYRLTPRNVLSLNGKLLFPRENMFQNFHNIYNGGESEKYRQTDITFNREMFEISMGYKHWITPQKEEINLVGSFSRIKGHRPSFYYEGGQMVQKSESGGSPHIASLQFDYLREFSYGKLEAGAKMTMRYNNIDHKFYEFDNATQSWQFSIPLSNDLQHHEYIPAIYSQFSGRFAERFTYSAGLRMELSRTELSNNHDELNENRTDLFISPGVTLEYKHSDSHNFAFGFSRRITRPTYPQLNPYINLIDNQTYETGNVHLKPENVNKIDLGYSFRSKIVNLHVSPYFNFVHDYIAQVATLDGNNLVMTYINGDWDIKAGVECMLKVRPLRWLSFDVNNNLFYTKATGSLSDVDVANSGLVNSMNTSLTITPLKGMNLQLQYFHITPQHFPQFTTHTIHYFDISLRQMLFQDKLSLTLALTDVFNTKRWDIHSDNSIYRLTNLSHNRSRMVWLGFTYNFNSFKSGNKKVNKEEDRSVIRLGN